MHYSLPDPDTLRSRLYVKPAAGKETTQAPDVTVVTVCLNPLKAGRRSLLEKNLLSVQNQQGVALEHIIVDGGSTDGTIEFLRSFNNKTHDIALLSQPDAGIYDAMNRGIVLARGRYITFLNSDDYYHRTDGLRLSVSALDHCDCDYSFAPIRPTGCRLLHRLHRHPERHLHRVILFPTVPHQSILYRRETLLGIGGYDPSYRMGGDHELQLRLIAAGKKGRFVPTPFVTFSTGGFSTQDDALKLQEKIRRVRRFHQEALSAELTPQEAETLVRRYRYPRRLLPVYVASQKIIDTAFEGLPRGLCFRLRRTFNYWKYYVKCLLGA